MARRRGLDPEGDLYMSFRRCACGTRLYVFSSARSSSDQETWTREIQCPGCERTTHVMVAELGTIEVYTAWQLPPGFAWAYFRREPWRVLFSRGLTPWARVYVLARWEWAWFAALVLAALWLFSLKAA